jgi:hypothetical protein
MSAVVAGGISGQRLERLLALLVVAIRAAYCLYALLVVAFGYGQYRQPGAAVLILAAALTSSAGLAVVVLRQRRVSLLVGIADITVAGAVLCALTAQIPVAQRSGSLNWSLAYAVACALWSALGGQLLRGLPAVTALGCTYFFTTQAGLARHPAAGFEVNVVVNAASPVLYFGVMIALIRVLQWIAAQMDASRARTKAQWGQHAVLIERERLFREVHQPVIATLELIAAESLPVAEARLRAHAQAYALRHILRGVAGAGPGWLRDRLSALVQEQAAHGWMVNVVDDELDRGLPRPVADALCEALCALLEPMPPVRPCTAQVRVSCSPGSVELVVRMAPPEARRFAQADAILATLCGQASQQVGLAHEARILMTVPA